MRRPSDRPGGGRPSPSARRRACPICHRRFYGLNDLGQHIRDMHPGARIRTIGVDVQRNGVVVDDNNGDET